jgi:hypothetical protein
VTIAVATAGLAAGPPVPGPRRSRRSMVKRIVLIAVSALVALLALVGSFVGFSLYRIDHAVHHVGVSPALLAKGKNDLLAIVKGPDHSEQVFVFHDTGGHTNVLQIPKTLGLPLVDGGTAQLGSLNLHAPTAIISGLDRLGIPVTHYVGVDLHMVNPKSGLGQFALGQKSITSMISNPAGMSSLLDQVASHIYLGPGTPVSAVLSLMNVPTAHPVSVPVERDVHGVVVLTAAFAHILRAFL